MSENDLYHLALGIGAPTVSLLPGLSFKQVAATAGDTRAALAQDFDTALGSAFASLMQVDFGIKEYRVASVTPAGMANVIINPASARNGSVTGDALPQQCATVVTLRTALGGRSYRGRMYLGGFGEASQVGGSWVAGHLTAVSNAFATLIGRYVTNAATNGYQLVVISRQLNGAIRPAPVATPVISYTVRSTVYTQRRRVIGVGV